MPTPGQELSSLNFESMIGGPLVAMVNAQTQSSLATVNFINQVGFTPDEGTEGSKKPIYVDFKYPKEVVPYVPAKLGTVTSVTITNGGSGYNTAPTVTLASPTGTGTTTTATATAVIDGGAVVAIEISNAGQGYTSSDTTVSFNNTGTGGSGAAATAVIDAQAAAVPAVYQDMAISVPILTMLPMPHIRIERGEIEFNAKINSMEYMDTTSDFKIGGSLTLKQGWGSGSVRLNVSASYQKTSNSGNKTDRTYSMRVHVIATQDEMPAGMERILSILEDAITARPAEIAGPA